MVVGSVTHIRVATSPGKNGRAVNNDIVPADQATMVGEVHKHDEKHLVYRRTRPLAPFALLGRAGGDAHLAVRIPWQSAGQGEGWLVYQPVMY
jgi:hypothetical protein